MTCRNCEDKDRSCKFHTSNNQMMALVQNNVQYSQIYKAMDIRNGKIAEVKMRPHERVYAKIIEITNNIATCSNCKQFKTCTVYTYVQKVGNITLQMCSNCIKTKQQILSYFRGIIDL